jgi:pyruvate/2-oxoglutarate dehydrogenase complex dihydrolipoamide dehydrogenase (E3) component
VERRWVGGSRPAVACLPSKNDLWSARVAHLVRGASHFGTSTGPVSIDMRKVRSRKRDMIDREIEFHLGAYKASGAELVMGSGSFVGTKTIEVALNQGGTRLLAGSDVVINVGTHAAIPNIPGLEARARRRGTITSSGTKAAPILHYRASRPLLATTGLGREMDHYCIAPRTLRFRSRVAFPGDVPINALRSGRHRRVGFRR